MEGRKNLSCHSSAQPTIEVIVVPGPGTNHPLHGYTKRQKLEVEWPGRKYELPACTVVSGFVRASVRRDRERLGTRGHL